MSAQQTLDIRQKIALGLILLISALLLYHNWFSYLLVMVGIANVAYVLVTLSKLLWLMHKPKFYASLASAEFDTTKTGKSGETLPIYTVLAPLYREANVLENLIQALKALDYPKDKLQILLLLEPDDHETADALKKHTLENPFRPITIPDTYPKTKPKACNVGLAYATGEYLVIYDAEDQPEPDQR